MMSFGTSAEREEDALLLLLLWKPPAAAWCMAEAPESFGEDDNVRGSLGGLNVDPAALGSSSMSSRD